MHTSIPGAQRARHRLVRGAPDDGTQGPVGKDSQRTGLHSEAQHVVIESNLPYRVEPLCQAGEGDLVLSTQFDVPRRVVS